MIAFVAQDAGGANLVLHTAMYTKSNFKLFAFGFAIDMANYLGIPIDSPTDSLSDVTRVIAGANFHGTAKESDVFLRKFQEIHLPIDGFLDGWDELGGRFPNIEIRNYLVVDKYSKRVAQSIYGARVKSIENYYMNHVLLQYKNILRELPQRALKNRVDSILYLSRPQKDRGSQLQCSNTNCICPDLHLIVERFAPLRIIVRDHPRLNSDLCIIRLTSTRSCYITKSSGLAPLAPDLARCEIAIGQSNPALLIAREAGLSTYTTGGHLHNLDGLTPRFNGLA